jgi:hypothetical protein
MGNYRQSQSFLGNQIAFNRRPLGKRWTSPLVRRSLAGRVTRNRTHTGVRSRRLEVLRLPSQPGARRPLEFVGYDVSYLTMVSGFYASFLVWTTNDELAERLSTS